MTDDQYRERRTRSHYWSGTAFTALVIIWLALLVGFLVEVLK